MKAVDWKSKCVIMKDYTHTSKWDNKAYSFKKGEVIELTIDSLFLWSMPSDLLCEIFMNIAEYRDGRIDDILED